MQRVYEMKYFNVEQIKVLILILHLCFADDFVVVFSRHGFRFQLQQKLFLVRIVFDSYCIVGDLHVPRSSLVTIVLSRPLLTRESYTLNCTLKCVGAEKLLLFHSPKKCKLSYLYCTASWMISSGSCKEMTVLMA